MRAMSWKQKDTVTGERVSTRRRFLGRAGRVAISAGFGGIVGTVAAQPASAARAADAPTPRPQVTQLLDMSADQQQLSRDYATGLRLAFAELAGRGVPAPQVQSIETDGSPAAVRQALQAVRADGRQVALVGTAGEALALASVSEAAQQQLDMAHVAPWLADSRFDADPRLFALFASREEQIRVVLRGLSVAGVSELGVIYPPGPRVAALQAGMAAVAERLKLRTRNLVLQAGKPLAQQAGALPANAPYFLLFMGGAIELALFTQGLGLGAARHSLLCLSDVDTNTFTQLSPGQGVSVIFTDVVPNPRTSKLAVVRAYRDALQRLFDEPPSTVSLAGYLAGRYAATVIAAAGPGASRARVLAEFQRRRPLDVDGWPLDFDAQGRGSRFVTQTLLNTRGEFVG